MNQFPSQFPCGTCGLEVGDEDEGIYCESGCEKWYHRQCVGMTSFAYDLLTAEDNAEWACDSCIAAESIPTVKVISNS